jgi:RimJ/RimL family protein N-acetyltransferase
MGAANRVWLRDVTEGDRPILFEFQLDEEANRMAAFAPRDWEAFLAHWERVGHNPTAIRQAIVCDGQVVGNIGCWEQDGHREIGYWIGREFWGRGIATKAVAAFVEQVKIRPIYGYVATHNIASRRVLEKCGFVVEGDEPAFTQLNGEDVAGIKLRLDAAPGDQVP